MTDSGSKQDISEKEDECRCVEYDPSLYDPEKEDVRLVQGDSGPFAMGFLPAFSINDVENASSSKTEKHQTHNILNESERNDDISARQHLKCDLFNSVMTSGTGPDERNGGRHLSSVIQSPQTLDDICSINHVENASSFETEQHQTHNISHESESNDDVSARSSRSQNVGCDLCNSAMTSGSEPQERNGKRTLSRIQHPQTPDNIESSAFYIQNRVFSRLKCSQDCSMGYAQDIEREYMLVPFSPNYSFKVLKDENDSLRARVQSLLRCGYARSVNEENDFHVSMGNGKSTQMFIPLDPLFLRILERSFSRYEIQTAFESLHRFSDYPVTATRLFSVLMNMCAQQRDDSDAKEDVSENDEEYQEKDQLTLHLTFKMQRS